MVFSTRVEGHVPSSLPSCGPMGFGLKASKGSAPWNLPCLGAGGAGFGGQRTPLGCHPAVDSRVFMKSNIIDRGLSN